MKKNIAKAVRKENTTVDSLTEKQISRKAMVLKHLQKFFGADVALRNLSLVVKR